MNNTVWFFRKVHIDQVLIYARKLNELRHFEKAVNKFDTPHN
jgi:hypothetical protein